METRLKASLLILLLLTGLVLAEDRRIEFMPGATGTRLEGSGQGAYLIRCWASQKMTVKVKNAAFQLYAPDGTRLAEGATWTGRLPQKGDYRIRVAGQAAYVLQVSVK
jgi:hypothetical protein